MLLLLLNHARIPLCPPTKKRTQDILMLNLELFGNCQARKSDEYLDGEEGQ